jgi:integrase
LVTGSNPVSGATFLKHSISPNITNFQSDSRIRKSRYDTSTENYDTQHLRLYKVSDVYYYRRRINYKLVRISLRTKNIHTALKRKKILDLMNGEEMFQLETKDIKLAFEYDTEEELRTALELAHQMQIEATMQKVRETKAHIETAEQRDLKTFENLRDLYILKLERDGNSNPEDYVPTFKRLIDFFKEKDIYSLTTEDIEAFKTHLSTLIFRKKNLSKRTINKHLIYLKRALKYVDINVADKVALYGKKQVRKDTPKKENYTEEELNTILNYDYSDQKGKTAVLLALYTGMRQGEIRRIEQEDIKQDTKTGIHYINIPEAKSEAGERVVPIHPDILELVQQTQFPLVEDIENKNQFSKLARRSLYKALNSEGKTFHTLRANFIDSVTECNKENPNKFTLYIIQEIVGHAKGDKPSLTLDTYKKGFNLEDKFNIICETVQNFVSAHDRLKNCIIN